MMKEVKVMADVSDKADDKEEEYDEWCLQSKANTLIEAEEIKADAKLMAALQPYLEKKVKAFNSIAQLKKEAKKKVLEGK